MFLAHKNHIAPGTTHSLDYFDKRKNVSNVGGKYVIVDNICPHQYAIINNGVTDNLVCPYHGREWHIDGCSKHRYVNLSQYPTYEQCGLLFDSPIDIESTFWLSDDYWCMHTRTQRVNASSQVIMDVFLDVDHIPHAHKDVYESIGLTDNMEVDWVYKEWGSIQLAKNKDKVCAVWVAVYPGTMIEWQPGALFITQCIPSTQNNVTDVQVFQYKEGSHSMESFAKNKKIWETAWKQDVYLAEHIVRRDRVAVSEAAKDHFRQWEARYSGFSL